MRVKASFFREHGWYTRVILDTKDLDQALEEPELSVRDL